MTHLFFDDFEQGLSDAWLLMPGWHIAHLDENHVLSGSGPCRAQLPAAAKAKSIRLSFHYKLSQGELHCRCGRPELGHYLFVVASDGLFVHKETLASEPAELGGNVVRTDADAWQEVEIICGDGRLAVSLNGRALVSHTDPDPPPIDSITFELPADAAALLDDVTISTAPLRLPDLDLHELISLHTAVLPLITGEPALDRYHEAKGLLQEAVMLDARGETKSTEKMLPEICTAYREAGEIGMREEIFPQAERRLRDGSALFSEADLAEAEALFQRAVQDETSMIDLKDMLDQISVILLAGGTAQPDLTVELYNIPNSPITGVKPSPPLTDRPTSLSVLVKNQGLAPVDKGFDIDLFVDGIKTKTWRFTPILAQENPPHNKNPLEAGESRIYDYTVNFPAGGQHNFKWVVDAKNEIFESDKTNNELSISRTWQKPPDLKVTSIAPEGSLAGGQKSVWRIEIKNIGQGDVNTPFLTAFRPNVPGGSQENFWANSLAAGQSAVFKSTQNFRAWGKHSIEAEVDVGNRVAEALPDGEKNNKLVKQFDLQPVDLAVENLTISPAKPLPYETTTLSFEIKNKGKANAAQPFKVRVYPGGIDAKKGTVHPTLLKVKPLSAGQSVTIKHQVKLPPGNHQIGIEADYPAPASIYFEADRNNNVLVKQIHVPDPVTSIAKVEPYKSCKNEYLVSLDRSGSSWKGDVLIKLVHQGKVLDELTIPAMHKTGIIGVSHLDPDTTLEGKYNWSAKVDLVAYAKVGPLLFKTNLSPILIDVRQYARPYLRSMSPTSGNPDKKVLVTLSGACLLLPNKQAQISVFPTTGGGVDPKVKPTVLETKVVNNYTDQISVELDIAADAPLGKRNIHISNCANWFWSAKFNVIAKGSEPEPEPKPEPPKKVKKPDLFLNLCWVDPSMTSPGGLPAGKAFTYYFKVDNIGSKEAAASTAMLLFNSGKSDQKSKKVNVPALKVGQWYVGAWKFSSGLPKGSYNIDVYVNFDNKVDELNPYNNKGGCEFIVGW